MGHDYHVFAVYRHGERLILVPLASYDVYANALQAADWHNAEEGEPALIVTTIDGTAVDMSSVGTMQASIPGRPAPVSLAPLPVFDGVDLLWKLVPVVPDASSPEGFRAEPALLSYAIHVDGVAFTS
ncbi:MAG: hypothetical protein KGM44_10435 [bacterium]|nr:hypothetical protein [bacterium]